MDTIGDLGDIRATPNPTRSCAPRWSRLQRSHDVKDGREKEAEGDGNVYLLGAMGDDSLVEAESLILRDLGRVVVPQQTPLDLRREKGE